MALNHHRNGLMWGFPQSKHGFFGMAGAGLLIYQRCGILLGLVEERRLLNLIRRQMDIGVVSMCNFGHPLSNKLTLWIQLLTLFDGIVYPQCVDSGCACLHLKLAEVDSRLVVGKGLCQVWMNFSPVQPEVVAGERDQHGPHPKVNPAVVIEKPHAGIHHWDASMSCFPGLKPFQVLSSWPQVFCSRVKASPLNVDLIFELLHEVAPPVKP